MMLPREAIAYLKKYRFINQIEVAELRRVSLLSKAQQLAAMMRLALDMNWHTSSQRETQRVRQRWNQLREHFGV